MMADSGIALNESVTNLYKAAVLLLTVGEETAAVVLRRLGPKQVQRIGAEMAGLTNVGREQVRVVFEDFLNAIGDSTGFGISADAYVRNAMIKALGKDKAAAIIDRILLGGNTQGLDTLKWMDSRAISDVIRQEHPQVQALVIAYLGSELSAEVLSHLPEPTRLEIMLRVAKMDTVQPDAVIELNDILEKQFAGASSTQKQRIGGAKVAADIMINLDGGIESEIMDGLVELDSEVSSEIQDLMFVFDDLLDMDDRDIQTLLREVSTELLVVALKGALKQLQEKIFANMSQRAAELLKDDLEAMGPMKVSDVEASQKEILAIARRMGEAGEINLGSSEAMV